MHILFRWSGILPNGSLPKDSLPKDILPNLHFADVHNVERTIYRMDFLLKDILPKRQFAENKFCGMSLVRITLTSHAATK